MLSLIRRAADKAADLFLPHAVARADHWGSFCYCVSPNGTQEYSFYEYWVWTGSAMYRLGCYPRWHGCYVE